MPMQMSMTSQTTSGGLRMDIRIYYGLALGDPPEVREAEFTLDVSWEGDYQVNMCSDGADQEDARVVWRDQKLARGGTAEFDVEFERALSEPVTATLTCDE